MIRTIYAVFFLVFSISVVCAQQYLPSGQNYYDDNKGIVYNQEFTVDLKMHTNGYALGVNIGKLKSYYKTTFINFELGEIKHPKEFRQSFDFQSPTTSRVSRAFIFGKQNNFFVLRGGMGAKRYFSEKAKRKGLAVGLSYEVGPSLGLLKPYYLELMDFPVEPGLDLIIRSEKYTEENAARFLDISRIYGASGFSKGLGELKVKPGGHAKLAVHFDWGAFDEFVKALEAGVMVDFYFDKIPIMVDAADVENVENRPLFINLYLNLQFGKRW